MTHKNMKGTTSPLLPIVSAHFKYETSGNCIKTHGNNEGQYCRDSFDNIEKENAREITF